MLEAYWETYPERLPLPQETDPRALWCEQLFDNPSLCDPASSKPIQPPAVGLPPGTPTTLGELCRAQPQQQEAEHLQPIMQSLPPSWRRLLDPEAPQDREEHPTWRLAPGGSWACSPEGQVHAVQPSGRVTEATASSQAPAGPTPDWVPACVQPFRKRRGLWTATERLAYEQAPPAEGGVA